MKTILLIGASRGIGHELARQYLAEGSRVIATARSDDGLARLKARGLKKGLATLCIGGGEGTAVALELV